MALRGQHEETTEFGDAFTQLDVRTTTGHVGGDRHRRAMTGAGDDFGLLAVILRIEHVVDDLLQLEHARDHFRGFDAGGADEDRLALGVELLDQLDDGGEFLAACLVDAVVVILALHRTVRRDGEHIEIVDVMELGGVGLSRAGHAAQLLVEAEVVLNGDGGERLRLGVDLHAFLGFHGLVQAIAPAASGHFTARLRIDDDDLVFLDHVLDVLLIETEGTQKLADLVNALALVGKAVLHFRFLAGAGLFGERHVAVDL